MPNTYFQFKQFTIQQERCAMKVTTDGCLLGALTASEIINCNADTFLDIGTGTGLLSLMVAQQEKNVKIDAIEIDREAAQQATENVAASPWAEKITVINGDVLDFEPAQRYDVIISNPPFYEQQLTSPNAGRNQAHHSSGLTLQQLFIQVDNLLKLNGKFYLMVPFYRTAEAIALAASVRRYPEKHWQVQQTPKHSFFRSIFCFSQDPAISRQSIEICIEKERNRYSKAFTDLMNPYYLKL